VFQAGAFIRHNIGQAYLKGAIAYGWHDVTTDRTVALAGIDKLEGRYNAHSFGARAEAGYRFLTPWMGVGLTPYAAGQAITYYLPGYGEQVALGLNTFALNYAARDVTPARSEIGLRTDKSFALRTALVTLRSRAAWAHYFDDNRSLTASFQTFAAPSFVVTGAAQARDVALVSASADVRWMNGISVAGVFEGEFSGQTRGYAGKGIVRYQW
jgi:outer membrane autotransporter protein